MLIIVTISILAFLLTFFESKGTLKGGMKWGFILVTILGALHYNYGNDYPAYQTIYKTIENQPFNWGDILSGYTYKEPGWALLCYLFKPFGGFFTMVAVLNIFQNYAIYKIIKSYVQKEWWPLAVAIYLFNTSFYLLSFSMMRQELVMCIFFAIWPLIEQKKAIKAALILIFCSLIHTSSMILIPFAFIGYLPARNGKFLALTFIAVFILVWIGKGLAGSILNSILAYESFSEYGYNYFENGNKVTFGLGYMLSLIPFILSIVYFWKTPDRISASNRRLVIISIFSFIITPFAQFAALITRVAMYFNIYSIVAYPLIYSNLRNKAVRQIMLLLYLYFMVYSYFQFFQSDVYHEYYTTYRTIIPEILLGS